MYLLNEEKPGPTISMKIPSGSRWRKSYYHSVRELPYPVRFEQDGSRVSMLVIADHLRGDLFPTDIDSGRYPVDIEWMKMPSSDDPIYGPLARLIVTRNWESPFYPSTAYLQLNAFVG